MVREVCSCGAEFETDQSNAVRLLREWRQVHRHESAEPSGQGSMLDAHMDLSSDPRSPELHIGFRPSEDE
jgi:hypothetical protein